MRRTTAEQLPHSLLPFVDFSTRLRILPVPLPVWQTPTSILTLRGRTLAPAVHVFLDTVRRQLAIGSPAARDR